MSGATLQWSLATSISLNSHWLHKTQSEIDKNEGQKNENGNRLSSQKIDLIMCWMLDTVPWQQKISKSRVQNRTS